MIAQALHVLWDKLNNLLTGEHNVRSLALHRLRVQYLFSLIFHHKDCLNLGVWPHYSESVVCLDYELPIQCKQVVDWITQFLGLKLLQLCDVDKNYLGLLVLSDCHTYDLLYDAQEDVSFARLRSRELVFQRLRH